MNESHNPRVNRRRFLKGVGGGIATASMVGVALSQSASGAGRRSAGAQSAPKKTRIGVVGGGFGCSFYWHEHPDCIVQAVSDLRKDRQERLANTYRCDNIYPSLKELLKDPDVDAVAMFTEATNHVRHCVMTMNAGKHVISAVPAGCSLEDLELLIETVKKTGMTYMMAETSYYRQEAITARQWYRQGKFGEIIFFEAEYHHPRPKERDKYPARYTYQGKPTWRWGYPPMLYPTHSLGFVTGVTGERLAQVSCLGFGEKDDAMLQDNVYDNPFSTSVAFYKTDRGHAVRHTELRRAAVHGCERAQWIGMKMSFYMPHNGLGQIVVGEDEKPRRYEQPMHWKTEMLPEPLRHNSGHGGSHTFLTHEFVDALVHDRRPAIDVYEAVAYTAPGIVAHQSALNGGEQVMIPDFGRAS